MVSCGGCGGRLRFLSASEQHLVAHETSLLELEVIVFCDGCTKVPAVGSCVCLFIGWLVTRQLAVKGGLVSIVS